MSPEEQAFWDEVNRLVKPVIPPTNEYRLYYNPAGDIVAGTQLANDEKLDLPYIVVDQKIYENFGLYYVEHDRLQLKNSDAGYRVGLRSSQSGFPVVKNHAGLVIEPGEEYNNTEYYERNN